MTGSDAAIFHLVDPITGFGNDWIMGGQEQRFPAFLDNVLQDFKSALGISGIEVAGRFIGKDHLRIIGQCASNRYALLLPSGKVPAFASRSLVYVARFFSTSTRPVLRSRKAFTNDTCKIIGRKEYRRVPNLNFARRSPRQVAAGLSKTIHQSLMAASNQR